MRHCILTGTGVGVDANRQVGAMVHDILFLFGKARAISMESLWQEQTRS